MNWIDKCHFGDCLETLRQMPDGIAQTCVTSPPYFGLRDYSGGAAEIGKEKTPDEFVAALVAVFREVRRVLADDGTLWLNIGDSYAANKGMGNTGRHEGGEAWGGDGTDKRAACRAAGIKPKDLIGIPWMLAFALRADGWYLRQDVIWHKPNPMPESVRDRCTKAHEYIFLLSKSARYFFDSEAMKEPATGRDPGNIGHKYAQEGVYATQNPQARLAACGARETRNRRSVWTVATRPYKGAHFATFPPALVEPCILAGSRPGDTALDPFFGSGTTGAVAHSLGRRFIGCELNPAYKALQDERLHQSGFIFDEVTA